MPELPPLIATKFHIPGARADLVGRPRLFALMDGCLQHPLTLISAPPGFGKTTLVAGWLAARPDVRCAWLALDERDNHLASFWRYTITALQQLDPALGHRAQEMLAAGSAPAIETILATLINDLNKLDAPLLLVLDDYHLIHQSLVHNSLKFFLDYQPAHFHLLLLTREDPPLGLARRRARRQLIELRAAELRFTPEESAVFLQGSLGQALNRDQLTLLERRTEGWIAGLQLAVLSMQGRDPQAFFQSFAGDDRYIADYLIEEVLEQQPPEVRQFLLKTSILGGLNASLCQQVTGINEVTCNGDQIPVLEYLERSNLFLVALDQRRQWFRYHHLFADLLRQRLKQSLPKEAIAGLHHKASQWHEANLDIIAAVQHAHQAGDVPGAARLLIEYAPQFFVRSELPQLVELVSQLPPALLDDNPGLCASAAWASLARGDNISPWLAHIERHFGMPAITAIEKREMEPGLRAALLEALILLQQTPYDAFNSTSQARLLAIQQYLDQLPDDQRCLFNDVINLRPVVIFNLGLDYGLRGEVEQAARCFEETIRRSRQQQNNHLSHLALGHLAQVQVARGQLSLAQQTYQEALAHQDSGSTSPFAAFAHAGLGMLAYERGDLVQAQQHFDAGLPMARAWTHWETLGPLALGQARLYSRQGNREAAQALLASLPTNPVESVRSVLDAFHDLLLAEAGEPGPAGEWLTAHANLLDSSPNPYNEDVQLAGCQLLAAVGRQTEAISLLQRLVENAAALGRNHLLIQAQVLLARSFALQGETDAAQNALVQALRLAEPQGYHSTFVDAGEPIRRLLLQLPGEAYTQHLLGEFAAQPSMPAKVGLVAGGSLISPREQEVLELLARGLSNQEITEELVISITTVKTHVSNIFNKLGVTSRTQAVAQARTAGLLPSS